MPTLIKPTDAKIRDLKPEAKPVKWLLGNNLYVFILPSGGKTYRWNYLLHGKHKTITIGSCDSLTLNEAKARRLQAAQSLADGIDPAAAKQQAKAKAKIEADNTFEAIARKWFEFWVKKDKISDNHAKKTWQRLQKDVLPKIGRMPIKNIDRAKIVTLSQAPINRGANDIAARALDTTANIFRYALNNGLIATDPCQNMKTSDFIPTTKVEHMARIKTEEVPKFLYALENTKMDEAIRLFLKIMMLVFTRKDELLSAKWEEFDFEGKVWNVHWERMKDKQDHAVPLAKQTIDLLMELKDMQLSPVYLFPALSRKSASGVLSDTAIRQAINKMGYKPVNVTEKGKTTQWGMSIHGFRGVASTALSETTNPASPSVARFVQFSASKNKDLGKNVIVEAQLAHKMGDGSSSPYNHAEHWDFRVIMMQEWADWIDKQRSAFVAPV